MQLSLLKILPLITFLGFQYVFAQTTLPGKSSLPKAPVPSPKASSSAPDPLSQKQKRPVELLNLIDDIRASTPEMAVDSLLTLIEQGATQDREWKKEILEDAFRLSTTVAHPFKRQSTVGNVDTRPGLANAAFRLNLDTLSLRCRAIRSMLTLDPKTAREWFDEIASFQLPSLNCDDLLVYDVSAFYELLPLIIKQGFNAEELRRREDLFLLQTTISRIMQPTQLRPLLNTLQELKLPADDLQLLLSTLNKVLLNLTGDPRSFDYAMIRLAADGPGHIVVWAEQKVTVTATFAAYRTFLLNNLNASRCTDERVWKGYPQELPRSVRYFNDAINRVTRTAEILVEPIAGEELKPGKTEKTAEAVTHWQTPEARQLQFKIKRLRFGSGRQPLNVTQRERREWQTELAEFRSEVIEWQGKQEKSEADFFHQKCSLFLSLADLIPPSSPEAENVVRAYFSYLEQNRAQHETWIEWYVNLLNAYRGAKPEVKEKLLNLCSGSKDLNLRLFARMTRMYRK